MDACCVSLHHKSRKAWRVEFEMNELDYEAPRKGRTQPVQPRQVWSERETSVLIDCWEDRIIDLRRQKRNSSIYEEIAPELRVAGFHRTKQQVHTKIENLSNKFRFWQKRQTTGSGAIPWTHFHHLATFLGRLPMNDASLVRESTGSVEQLIRTMETGECPTDDDQSSPAVHNSSIWEGADSGLQLPSAAHDSSNCEGAESGSQLPSAAADPVAH
ncbi:hypothetical protein V5799_015757 [Amblyomma americanum]|uniref:Myb/SANT-like DNA-binding domain-containing protein n=1 Tax=Amblyomma americanum TaxID=6943 RepID=A0AAQ4F8B6_AMBAM